VPAREQPLVAEVDKLGRYQVVRFMVECEAEEVHITDPALWGGCVRTLSADLEQVLRRPANVCAPHLANSRVVVCHPESGW
jgi:hypothetical protein